MSVCVSVCLCSCIAACILRLQFIEDCCFCGPVSRLHVLLLFAFGQGICHTIEVQAICECVREREKEGERAGHAYKVHELLF